jgi:hypothetical protein
MSRPKPRPSDGKDVVAVYVPVDDKVLRPGSLARTDRTERMNITVAREFHRRTINDYEDVLADMKQ